MARMLFSTLALVAVTTAVPGAVHCQLHDVQWIENLSMGTDRGEYANGGSDPALPEPLHNSVRVNGGNMTGDISYYAGPPNVYCTLQGEVIGPNQDLVGDASSRIVFEFAVRQTAPPPVAVSSVPVLVTVDGWASADGDPQLHSSALVSVDLSTTHKSIGHWSVQVDNSREPKTDTFHETARYELGPHQVVTGTMLAIAALATDIRLPDTEASAGAWVDPVIAVAGETIPGTAAMYRDYFQIETSPGYWILDTVPAEKTTWGRLKRMYGH